MDLLNKQVTSFERIKTLCSNYKKDSISRKTIDYLETRISGLDKEWEEFHKRHEELVAAISDKTNVNYFTNDIYEKTRQIYDSTKKNMLDLLTTQRQQHQLKPEFDLTGLLEEEPCDKLKELLNSQEGNFKALDRAMSKVNIESLEEKWELEDHLSVLKLKWEAVDKFHWQLETALKGSPLKEEYESTFESLKQRYDNLRKLLNTKIWTNLNYQRSAPKSQLPDFSGDYIQWLSFKQLFIESIHNNPAIAKCQKMTHLIGKLKDEAKTLVQHLTISSENYDSCWKILTHRYDNRRLQFAAYMDNMQQLSVIQQPNSDNLKKLHDVITITQNGLTNMGVDVSTWGPMIVYHMAQKLDTTTYNEYTKEMKDGRAVPDIDEFLTFLENKFISLETGKKPRKEFLNNRKTNQAQTFHRNFQKTYNKYIPAKSHSNVHNSDKHNNEKSYLFERNKDYSKTFHTSYGKCPLCESEHVLMQCDKFIEMDTEQRNNIVANLNVCKNCLFSHGNNKCTSQKTCKQCNLKHHTLLHIEQKSKSDKASRSQPSTSRQQNTHHLYANDIEVLLTTVQVKVQASNGTYITLRALLDQGSQTNLITENAAQLLRQPRTKFNATISGIGSTTRDCKGRMNVTCKSIHSDYTFSIDTLILTKLTNNLPSQTFKRTNWSHIENLKLADPDFNVSSSIDLLLGADVYADIILDGIFKGDQQEPIAQQTKLGWILCGKLKTFNCHITIVNLSELSKYWETEDITQGPEDINQDDQCEIYYKQTTRRASDGKFIVKMPMVDNFEEKLGKSRTIAISQFLQLEKRFKKNNKLGTMYKDFMKEYYELQHMKPLPCISDSNQLPSFYLPHHGVLREDSSTTKMRVVFNGSQKTTTGNSLNCLMRKGPNLQKDMLALILKWRTYKYAYTADIEKMYRCIWLDESQHNLQKIIWRDSQSKILQEYALCTVTYGTKCAPWLALRTLKQLAMQDAHKYPIASKILQNEFFVDDLASGHNELDIAKHIQTSLIALLKGGGMNLRKWSSNSPELLHNLKRDQISKSTYDFKHEDSMKTLGLGWNPNLDTFVFKWNLKPTTKPLTKRILLSEISQLYDPLGWFSPITITAKLIFQRIWTENLLWDESLPQEIQSNWLKLKTELSYLQTIKINRWIGSTNKNIELLAFCDASEKAYACVIYLRAKDETGQNVITLLTAKTRVAPLSQKTTLPRLELCGAILLSQLIQKIKESLSEHNIAVWAWCDSKVVLAWIQGEDVKWERYVENRVVKIKQIVPASRWNYIDTKSNPADCATRGLYPSKLVNLQLWWQGPTILNTFEGESHSEVKCLFTTNIDKRKDFTNTDKVTNNNIVFNLLTNYSSLTRANRVLCWILRFIIITRKKITAGMQSDTYKALPPYLTINELDTANNIIIKYAQNIDFNVELDLLSKNRSLTNKSVLYKLNPFLDKDGIIRVGGRLNKTNLPLSMKNPVIVSRNGRFTQLIIEQAHLRTLHGGARLTLAYIRQRYWIIGGNRAVKTQLRRCVRCHRFKPQDNYQLMADLPSHRVTPCRPFTHCGVDFTGHVDVKLNKGRGVTTSKGYVAIFICMTTKAVHIELVSDLSSETFIAAFQRLCARRGTPKHVYSDCGTNFVGAAKILKGEFKLFQEGLPTEFFDHMGKLEVEWHFNAPAWPTAGGLWEAAVRSMKYHLRRILGDQRLTYEELSTLLAKIEACMNSRPLCSLTEDPDEFNHYLTPGHFLTGTPTMMLPVDSHEDDRKLNLKQRWRLTEHMLHQFWRTWSSEYLTQLQGRSKWQKSTRNLQKDDVVLIKDNNIPPGKWAMGRITEVHPGSDGKVRVTTIKTQFGLIKRPITKISPLPINDDSTECVTEKDSKITSTARNTLKKTFLIISAILFTFLSVCSSVNGADSRNITRSANITSLGANRPIYYEHVGDIQLIHDEWKLLMYFNLSAYWDGVQKIEQYLGDLHLLCKRLDPRYCEVTMEQLLHEQELLKHYNVLLLSPDKHLSSRHKRGLIDGVGYLANSLFGILDQHFADKYKEDIQSLQNNENYLLELIKNQTSIAQLENGILEKSEFYIKRQFSIINDYMNETDIKLEKIESAIEIAMAANYFSSSSLTAYLLLNNLKNIQDMLFTSLTDVYQGHIDVHLLTPVNLISQLTFISGSLPKTLSLPVNDLQHDIKNIYKLLYARTRITSEYFLLEVHIPLTSHEDYSLLHMIPLPLKTSRNETTAVQVSSNFIAMNFRKNTYVSITDDQLTYCIKINSKHSICNINLPVQHIENINAPCEVKLLSQQTISSCNIQKIPCEERWIELRNQNTWIVLCCDTCTLRTVCDYDVTTHILNTSSIVSLKQGCILQTKSFMIHSRYNYNSKAKIDFDIQVPSLDVSINSIVSTQNTPKLELFEDKDIKIARERLQHLENHERLPASITTNDLHQFIIIYLLLGAIGITTIFWIAKKRGWCTKQMKVNPNNNSSKRYEEIELQSFEPKTTYTLARSYSMAERGTKDKPRPTTSTKARAKQAEMTHQRDSAAAGYNDNQFTFD